jgi:hypothetical protein
VAPPPVSGAAVGNAGVTGAAVCVTVRVTVGFGVTEWDARGESEARAEPEACGEPDADALPRPVEVAVAEAPDDLEDWPVGDGVRVPDWLGDCPLVWGVGVKIDGTDEPPLVQADTVTASRTAPAAERPAISHAPWAATGGVRRIFMNPPRMRVRLIRFSIRHASGGTRGVPKMKTALQVMLFPAIGHQPSTRAENKQKNGGPGHPASASRADQRIFRHASRPRGQPY